MKHGSCRLLATQDVWGQSFKNNMHSFSTMSQFLLYYLPNPTHTLMKYDMVVGYEVSVSATTTHLNSLKALQKLLARKLCLDHLFIFTALETSTSRFLDHQLQ